MGFTFLLLLHGYCLPLSSSTCFTTYNVHTIFKQSQYQSDVFEHLGLNHLAKLSAVGGVGFFRTLLVIELTR